MSIGSTSKLKNDPKKKPTEFNPYQIDKLSKIKPGVKIGFLKFWISGAAFFLTFTAIQTDILDLMFALLLILTLSVEYITNKVIVWMDNDRGNTLQYLPHHVKRKSMLSLFATMGYVAVMIVSSYFLIEGLMSIGIPSIGMIMFGFDNTGIDPITFGLVFWLMDFFWLVVKNFLMHHKKK
jgi:putative flippase GtrA